MKRDRIMPQWVRGLLCFMLWLGLVILSFQFPPHYEYTPLYLLLAALEALLIYYVDDKRPRWLHRLAEMEDEDADTP